MNQIKPLLGQRIIEACEDANIPAWGRNRVLGKQLSVSPAAVSKWLSNKALPTIDKLFELATFLNVRAEWLVTGKEPKKERPQISSDEISEVIEIMNGLSSDQRRALLTIVKTFNQSVK